MSSDSTPANDDDSDRISDEEFEGERFRKLEHILPELFKKVVESGYKNLPGRPEVAKILQDMKLPKEAMGYLLSQIDDTTGSVQKAVAREIREFLEGANLAEELTKVLTAISFEIRTEVRFIPNEQKSGRKTPKADVKAKVRMKRRRSVPPVEEEEYENEEGKLNATDQDNE